MTWLAAAIATAQWLCVDLRLSLGRRSALLRPWPRLFAAVALTATSVVWYEARGTLGFHVRHADLERLLPRETRSEHFVLRTDPTAESDADIDLAQQDLEFRYQQLARILGVEPALPVTVYRFPSSAAKKDAVGAANTLYAKPWTREIFVQADHFPAQRLRHELAHVFASAFGDRMFGVSLAWHFVGPSRGPPWPAAWSRASPRRLISTTPTDARPRTRKQRPCSRSARRPSCAAHSVRASPSNPVRVPTPLPDRSAAFSSTASARRSCARSIARPAISRASTAATYRRWKRIGGAFLFALPADESSRAQAEESFRRPAIFQKVCARELAARVSEARARLGTAPGDSVALLSSACADDPNEPTFRLDLAEALVAAGDSDRALATLPRPRPGAP
jgi:hypothetical protein